MWADGVFDPLTDHLLFALAAGLSAAVAWWKARRPKSRRSGRADALFWIAAAMILPPVIYFSAAMGLWAGALITNATLGAQIGWVLLPPLATYIVIAALNCAFPRR